MRNRKVRLFIRGKIFFFNNWWVFLLLLISYGVFYQGIIKKRKILESFQKEVIALEETKESALQQQGDLMLRMQSQSDPDWIEMRLKERLGVVPEGQIKIVFE